MLERAGDVARFCRVERVGRGVRFRRQCAPERVKIEARQRQIEHEQLKARDRPSGRCDERRGARGPFQLHNRYMARTAKERSNALSPRVIVVKYEKVQGPHGGEARGGVAGWLPAVVRVAELVAGRDAEVQVPRPATGSATLRTQKQKRPSSRGWMAVSCNDWPRSELAPPFFSRSPPAVFHRSGGPRRGLDIDSQAGWPSHLVHRCQRCESDRVADRSFAEHSEAPDRRG